MVRQEDGIAHSSIGFHLSLPEWHAVEIGKEQFFLHAFESLRGVVVNEIIAFELD